MCFIPGSIHRLCLWVVRLCDITDLCLVSRLGDVGKDKSQFLSHQDVRSPSEGYHHRLVTTRESPRSFVLYALHPGSKILEGRKGRSFLSACRQPDGPTLCRWSLAAVSSVGCWAEAQTALGKGCRRRLARSSLVWPTFFPIRCFCLKILVDNAVSQAVLMWSAVFLLGTVDVFILWFGFFFSFFPLHQ